MRFGDGRRACSSGGHMQLDGLSANRGSDRLRIRNGRSARDRRCLGSWPHCRVWLGPSLHSGCITVPAAVPQALQRKPSRWLWLEFCGPSAGFERGGGGLAGLAGVLWRIGPLALGKDPLLNETARVAGSSVRGASTPIVPLFGSVDSTSRLHREW